MRKLSYFNLFVFDFNVSAPYSKRQYPLVYPIPSPIINVRDAGPSNLQFHFLQPKSAAQNETLDSDIEERCRPTYTLYIHKIIFVFFLFLCKLKNQCYLASNISQCYLLGYIVCKGWLAIAKIKRLVEARPMRSLHFCCY